MIVTAPGPVAFEADGTTVKSGYQQLSELCDFGSCKPGDEPEGWVTITFATVSLPSGSGLDANGNMMHLLVSFPPPGANDRAEGNAQWTQRRSRRRRRESRMLPTGIQNGSAPINVEMDPGTIYCDQSVKLYAVGGVPGDTYEVTAAMRSGTNPCAHHVTYSERELEFWLSYYSTGFTGGILPVPVVVAALPFHTNFRLISGAAVLPAGAIVTQPGTQVPLNTVITLAGVTAYQTGGLL